MVILYLLKHQGFKNQQFIIQMKISVEINRFEMLYSISTNILDLCQSYVEAISVFLLNKRITISPKTLTEKYYLLSKKILNYYVESKIL